MLIHPKLRAIGFPERTDTVRDDDNNVINIATNVDTMNDIVKSLNYILYWSASARELLTTVTSSATNGMVYVCIGDTIQETSGVNNCKVNNSDGCTLIRIMEAMPSYFADTKDKTYRVNWGLIILHELGHAWQDLYKQDWSDRFREKYANDAGTLGFIVHDFNNLINWEWPIWNELKLQIREHYHLFHARDSYALRARQAYKKTVKVHGQKSFIDFRYKAGIRGGIWTPCAPRIKDLANNWRDGAPWRYGDFGIVKELLYNGSSDNIGKQLGNWTRKKKSRMPILNPKVKTRYKKGNTAKYHDMLKRTRMKVSKTIIATLPKVNANTYTGALSDPYAGGILVHYFPVDDAYAGELTDPRNFSSPSHCSIYTGSGGQNALIHSTPGGVIRSSLKNITESSMYCILFVLKSNVNRRDKYAAEAIENAKFFMNEGHEYGKKESDALGPRVFLRTSKFNKLSRIGTGYGNNAKTRRDHRRRRVLRLRELEKWYAEKRKVYRSQPESLLIITAEYEHEKGLLTEGNDEKMFCSQFVIICYQIAIPDTNTAFLQVDPLHTTPVRLEKELRSNSSWEPALIIEPYRNPSQKPDRWRGE